MSDRCIGERWYRAFETMICPYKGDPKEHSVIVHREDYLNQFINDLFQDTTSIFDNEDQMIHVREWLMEGLIPPKESEAGE